MTEAESRRIVYERSGRRCEMCRRPATDYAHRIGRGQGGLWVPSNACDLCHACHMWATGEPRLAALGGWRIETGEYPADVAAWLSPVQWWPGWWRLDDAGCYEFDADRHDVPVLPAWALAA